MTTTQDVRTDFPYKTILKEQGRTVNWLVAQLSRQRPVSRQYVSALINGKYPMSEEWERRIRSLLG